MARHTLRNVKVRHTVDVEDPFTLGYTIKIRRSQHPKVDDRAAARYQTLAAKLTLATAPAMRSTDLEEVEAASAKVADLQAPMREAKEDLAISLVAGWSGGDPANLPRKGAFSRQKIRRVLFLDHGQWDDEEMFIVPRFMLADGSAFVDPDDEAAGSRLAEIVAEHDAALTQSVEAATDAAVDAFLAEKKGGEVSGLPAETTGEEGRLAIQRLEKAMARMQVTVDKHPLIIKAEEEAAAWFAGQLEKLGIMENPYWGMSLRSAMADFILTEARKLQNEMDERTGFLFKNSKGTPPSKPGAVRRTRKRG